MNNRTQQKCLISASILLCICHLPLPLFAQQSNSTKKKPQKQSTEESQKAASGESPDKNSKKETSKSKQTSKNEKKPQASDLVQAAQKEGIKTAEIEQFNDIYADYTHELKDYTKTVDSAIEAEFIKQRKQIRSRYRRQIEKLEAIESNNRTEAIDSIKAFLEDHPDIPQYTPDAKFRLAELEFEKANAEYKRQNETYREQLSKYKEGKRPNRPAPPRKDYSGAITQFEQLIQNWRKYRQVDGAYYLLAYIKQRTGKAKEAKKLFTELIDTYPRSQFIPEAWLRIGEYHFQYARTPSQIKEARRAYRKAADYTQSRFYDKALYKLAWTNYRLNNYGKAVKTFKELVRYSDQQAEAGKAESALRQEAVQYMAVSLARSDWNLDGRMDPGFALPRTKKYIDGEDAFGREVLVELANYLFEDDLYNKQTKVIEYALQTYPLHPGNPRLHEKLILGLTRADKLERAFEVRNRLGSFYARESKWYQTQKKEGEYKAIDRAEKLVKENLLGSAKWFHQRAQRLRQKSNPTPSEKAQSRKLYEKAANGYAHFLKKYPYWDNGLKLNLHYADALMYGGQPKKAFEQYTVIRELDIEENPYREESAFKAIKAKEKHLSQLQKEGKIGPWLQLQNRQKSVQQTAQSQTKDRTKPKKGVESESDCNDLPGAAFEYVTSMDRYVVLKLQNKKAEDQPLRLAFQAGKVFYDRRCYDPAIDRFAWLVENAPESNFAFLAGSLILESYRQQKEYEKLAKWANRLDDIIKGEQAEAIKAEVQEFKLGAMFKSARQLQNEGKYEKAAEEYMRLVNKNPNHKFAAKAINNAAVAYEQIHKYESALELYRRVYKEYSESPLSGYALYRVGVNSERFFEFEEALQTYLDFYHQFKGGGSEELDKLDFKIPEKRATALKSAAVLAENLQDYSKAAGLFGDYVSKYPGKDETDKVQWKAIQNWKKAKRPDKMIAGIKTYRKRFGTDPENMSRVFEGLMMIAKHYRARDKTQKADKWLKEIVNSFEQQALEPGSESAQYAAEAQFLLAEQAFAEWKKISLEGSLSEQKKALQSKIKGSQRVSKKYQKVFEYKSLEWTLAGGYRIGSLYKNFADTLYNAPVPFEKGSEEYRVYRQELENRAMPIEDKAVANFKKTLKKARDENIVNKWTKKTLEALNQFRPGKYPLYKESLKAAQTSPLSGAGLIGIDDYETAQQSSTSKKKRTKKDNKTDSKKRDSDNASETKQSAEESEKSSGTDNNQSNKKEPSDTGPQTTGDQQ